MIPPLLVLDKSFAHAVKAERLASVSRDYTLLIPSAFIFEIFDTEVRKRLCAVTGLGQFMQIHLAELLAQEIEARSPASSLRLRPLVFNPVVLTPDWTLAEDEASIVSNYEHDIVVPKTDFWEGISDAGVPGFTTEELASARRNEAHLSQLCERLRDRGFIRAVAPKLGVSHAEILDESWLSFRHVQAHLLQGLLLQYHYPASTTRKRCDLEHDVQDLEYLILGLHVGGLATGETSERKHAMAWRFNILDPNALLVTPP